MSTDSNLEGQSFARWLDQWGADGPGPEPPSDVDADVVEAAWALRPDRAPAPRVTADDILALVESGPLASGARAASSPAAPPPREAQVVELAAARPRSRLSSFGGWSGVGLALAAAATFLIVAVPTLQGRSVDEAAPSPAMEQAPTAERAAAPAAPAPPPPPAQPSPAPALDEPAQRPARAAPPPDVPAVPPVPPTYDMDGAAAVQERDLIPELADAEGQGVDLDELRAAASSAAASDDAWRSAVSTGDADRVSALLDAAAQASAAGDPRQAGDIASRGIAPPAAAAHAAAWAASSHYLSAGDRSAAATAAARGLQFDGATPDRARLALRYGDLLRSSDPEGAARWYREAAR